jgi:HPt (histidine-containing phosphotransfer) domain-containing protein
MLVGRREIKMTKNNYEPLNDVTNRDISQSCSEAVQLQQTRIASDSKDIFDEERFLATWHDDTEFAKELCNLFIRDCPDLFATLCAASHRGDTLAVQTAAHQLKGVVANFEARRATTLLRTIEKLAKDRHPLGTGLFCSELESELHSLSAALEQMMVNLS